MGTLVASILTVQGLSKAFGELKVLQSVDLDIEGPGIHSLIGPNGAGKSTLFNCISGYLEADTGSVRFQDADVTRMSPVRLVRRGLIRTFQISSVFPTLSVEENVSLALVKSNLGSRLGILSSRRDRKRQRTNLEAILEQVGLGEDKWHVPAGALSHGDVRSLEVAIALACQPSLLCLDEPTAGMGIGESAFFAEMISDLARTVPVLLVEHRIEMVLSLSNRITVLAAGKVIADGAPDEIARNQQVRDAYLGVATRTEDSHP